MIPPEVKQAARIERSKRIKDSILKPVQLCVTPSGNHDFLPTTGKGMQCYSCPMCSQRIYWSEILKKWVKVDPKKDDDTRTS